MLTKCPTRLSQSVHIDTAPWTEAQAVLVCVGQLAELMPITLMRFGAGLFCANQSVQLAAEQIPLCPEVQGAPLR